MDESNTFCNYALKEHKSIHRFQNKSEYIDAMVEDLCEWLNFIYKLNDESGIRPKDFFNQLRNGVILCMHAEHIQRLAEDFICENRIESRRLKIKSGNQFLRVPEKPPIFKEIKTSKTNQSFLQRINLANFIEWCRSFNIPSNLTFETDDLFEMKNAHQFVICLLEVAKIGGCFGLEVPDIIKLDEEINQEILNKRNSDSVALKTENKTSTNPSKNSNISGLDISFGFNRNRRRSHSVCESPPRENFDTPDYASNTEFFSEKLKNSAERKIPYIPPVGQIRLYDCFHNLEKTVSKRSVVKCDLKTLDEKVKELVQRCSCSNMFPMKKVKDGTYEFGDKRILIFVRILRNHVMVRVGGGWDVLSEFLQRHDPCRREKADSRSNATSIKQNMFQSALMKLTRPTSHTTPSIKGISQGMLRVKHNRNEFVVDQTDRSTNSCHSVTDSVSTKEKQVRARSASVMANPSATCVTVPNDDLIHSPTTLEFQFHEMQSQLFMHSTPFGLNPEIEESAIRLAPRASSMRHKQKKISSRIPVIRKSRKVKL